MGFSWKSHGNGIIKFNVAVHNMFPCAVTFGDL